MPEDLPRKHLQPGDLLLRKVSPGQWTPSPYEPDPVAFEPKGAGLSFFRATHVSPYDLLNHFSQYKGVWKLLGSAPYPPVEVMVRAGFRVAVVDAGALMDFGITFAPTEDGSEWSPSGHVNALDCEMLLHDIAQASRLLPADECLSRSLAPSE